MEDPPQSALDRVVDSKGGHAFRARYVELSHVHPHSRHQGFDRLGVCVCSVGSGAAPGGGRKGD